MSEERHGGHFIHGYLCEVIFTVVHTIEFDKRVSLHDSECGSTPYTLSIDDGKIISTLLCGFLLQSNPPTTAFVLINRRSALRKESCFAPLPDAPFGLPVDFRGVGYWAPVIAYWMREVRENSGVSLFKTHRNSTGIPSIRKSGGGIIL